MLWYGFVKRPLCHQHQPHCKHQIVFRFSFFVFLILYYRFYCRDASIQRLGNLKLTDARYKMRSTQSSTILEQFLRGRGSAVALPLLCENSKLNPNDTTWQFTLLPLMNIVGQLMYDIYLLLVLH